MTPSLPSAPPNGWRVVELGPQDAALLQRFYDANPEYFLAVGGQPATPTEAHDELHGRPPAGFAYTRQWVLGHLDADAALAAMALVVSDLFAVGVWHVGLFIVATARHGHGDAQALYEGIEHWARANGAAWMRLGVVQGHARAERFWAGRGFVEVRTRDAVPIGRLERTVRVMVKPLADGALADYLALVSRDRTDDLPDSAAK